MWVVVNKSCKKITLIEDLSLILLGLLNSKWYIDDPEGDKHILFYDDKLMLTIHNNAIIDD